VPFNQSPNAYHPGAPRPLGEGKEGPSLSEMWPAAGGGSQQHRRSPEPSAAGGAGPSSSGAGGGLVRSVTQSDVSIRLVGGVTSQVTTDGGTRGAGGVTNDEQHAAQQQARFEAVVAAAVRVAAAGGGLADLQAAMEGAPGEAAPAPNGNQSAPGPAEQADVFRRVAFLLRWGFLLDDVVGDDVDVLLKYKAGVDAAAKSEAEQSAAAAGGDPAASASAAPVQRRPKAPPGELSGKESAAVARVVARCTPGAVGFYLLSVLHRLTMAALFGGFHYRQASESQVRGGFALAAAVGFVSVLLMTD